MPGISQVFPCFPSFQKVVFYFTLFYFPFVSRRPWTTFLRSQWWLSWRRTEKRQPSRSVSVGRPTTRKPWSPARRPPKRHRSEETLLYWHNSSRRGRCFAVQCVVKLSNSRPSAFSHLSRSTRWTSRELSGSPSITPCSITSITRTSCVKTR